MCEATADNELSAQGIVALAPTLGKLVALTSLNLSSTSSFMWCECRKMGVVSDGELVVDFACCRRVVWLPCAA